jgi:nicotinamidase-related amidase
MRLEIDRTALVVIDVQEKLAAVMHNPDALRYALYKIVAGAKTLGIPIIWNEQNPERMGPTVTALREILAPDQPISKMSFGCCGCDAFLSALQATGRDQILIAGIEAHVCVYQTAQQLMEKQYHVQVVADAVSARNPLDLQMALQRISFAATLQHAALSPLTTAESALFELMQTAEHPRFKDILKIIR